MCIFQSFSEGGSQCGLLKAHCGIKLTAFIYLRSDIANSTLFLGGQTGTSYVLAGSLNQLVNMSTSKRASDCFLLLSTHPSHCLFPSLISLFLITQNLLTICTLLCILSACSLESWICVTYATLPAPATVFL